MAVEAGVLDLTLGAVLSGAITVAAGAELKLAGLGGSQLDALDVSGEGLWTVSGSGHDIGSETIIALGTANPDALESSGLVLDDVSAFGEGSRNLIIGREDASVVSRLV